MNQKYVLDNKKVMKFSITFACIILAIFLAFRSIKYLAPFIVAFIIASIMEPLVNFLTKNTKIPRKIISAITVVAVMFLLGSILYLAISKILIEIKELMHTTPHFVRELYRNVDLINSNSSKFIIGLPEELTKYITNGIAGSFSTVKNLLNNIFRAVFDYAISLPSTLVL